ncbi:hypothetical protein COV20_04120 [Candidatus Woesearchaeota archaeon CG10_big_fil_rev_8_21_14_0_10_45_16]|nr:MAG: hypothetical protein COV20_04120 [Candidatus Woesearchaeota archaeon CG10_big_fil_rev_8_21_14_0_10_45_16]
MVMDLSTIFAYLAVILAGLAAVAGVVTLAHLFNNKLKTLFDDANYFILFFLVSGYFLYALGEVSYFLDINVLNSTGLVGIGDVYWTAGAFFIILSFLALVIVLFRRTSNFQKILAIFGIAAVLLGISAYILFSVVSPLESFFLYLYPIVSSLIVALASCSFIFSKELGPISKPLSIFFFASLGILLGDVIYDIGFLVVADILYTVAYGMSAAGFLTLGKHLRSYL